MPRAPRIGSLLTAALAALVVAFGSGLPAVAQDAGGRWPEVDSCESVFRARPVDGDEADQRRAGALIAHLRDPRATYELTFTSRNTRHGAIYADGEQLDRDVPAIQLDLAGSALVERPDHLAFIGSPQSRWSYAEMRRDGEHHSRFAPMEQRWDSENAGDRTTIRLPDAMSRIRTATPVAAPAGLEGHWFEVTTSADLGPGTMWDSTKEVFEVIRDVDTRLLVEADDDGAPVMACLWQSWWQGEAGIFEDEIIGEDASLASAIRFELVGSAPPLPSGPWISELVRSSELDIEVAVPDGGQVDDEGSVFWAWLNDEDEPPRLRVSRSRVPEWGLVDIREMHAEDVLEALAQEYAASALQGWGVDALTVESTRIGGADGSQPVQARLLTFSPELSDGETYTGIDIVTFIDPWFYHLQLLAPIENHVGARYLLERTLEGTRFLCSPGDDGACP